MSYDAKLMLGNKTDTQSSAGSEWVLLGI